MENGLLQDFLPLMGKNESQAQASGSNIGKRIRNLSSAPSSGYPGATTIPMQKERSARRAAPQAVGALLSRL